MKGYKFSGKDPLELAKALRKNYLLHLDSKRDTIESSDPEFKEILATLKEINTNKVENTTLINIINNGNGCLGKIGNTINVNYIKFINTAFKKELIAFSKEEVKLTMDVYREYIKLNGVIVSENSLITSIIEQGRKNESKDFKLQVFINNGDKTRHYPLNEDEIKFKNCAFIKFEEGKEGKEGMFGSYSRKANNNLQIIAPKANSDLDTKENIKLGKKTINNANMSEVLDMKIIPVYNKPFVYNDISDEDSSDEDSFGLFHVASRVTELPKTGSVRISSGKNNLDLNIVENYKSNEREDITAEEILGDLYYNDEINDNDIGYKEIELFNLNSEKKDVGYKEIELF